MIEFYFKCQLPRTKRNDLEGHEKKKASKKAFKISEQKL